MPVGEATEAESSSSPTGRNRVTHPARRPGYRESGWISGQCVEVSGGIFL